MINKTTQKKLFLKLSLQLNVWETWINVSLDDL